MAIDAKKVSAAGESDRWEIFTHGGRERTGIDAVAFAREAVERGAGEILLTSMDRDGTKSGYDIALTRAIADAVLCASIFHYGRYSIAEVKDALADAGVPVRPLAA